MSNTINVNKISVPQTVGQSTVQTDQVAPKRAQSALFSHSSFKQVAGTALPGGVSLPTFSQDQQQQINSLFGGLSDDDQSKVQRASEQLAGSIWQAVGVTSPPPAVGESSSASSAQLLSAAAPQAATTQGGGVGLAAAGGVSRQTVSIQTPGVYTNNGPLAQATLQAAGTYAAASGSNDPDKNVAAVTYMGLIGLQTDLADYASVVSAQNNRLQAARTQYANLTDTVANWPKGQNTVQFSWTDLDAKGNTVQTTGALTQDQAKAKADQLQNNTIPQLSSTNQIQQLQLQNLTQNYQQGVNTLTNVLKFQFDTVKSIIGNIRAS